MRLRISRDMGLNHGGLLGVGLLLSTALAHAPCSNCVQSWLLLASNLQATTMVVLAAFLFKPVKPSQANGLVMQVHWFLVTPALVTMPIAHKLRCQYQEAALSQNAALHCLYL